MFLKKFGLLATASLMTLSLGACTSSEEQQVLNEINAFCVNLPIGTAIAVTVVSSIPALAPGGALVQAVGTAAAGVCTSVVADLEKIVSNINNNGGTATVNVSSQNASAVSSMRRVAKHYGVPVRVYRDSSGSTVLSFVVPPSNNPLSKVWPF